MLLPFQNFSTYNSTSDNFSTLFKFLNRILPFPSTRFSFHRALNTFSCDKNDTTMRNKFTRITHRSYINTMINGIRPNQLK